jgi:hypothetical protein
MVYGFWLPFGALTSILIVVLNPASRNVMVRACPEVMLVGCPFGSPLFALIVMVAAVSCNVGVTVTLVTVLTTSTE